MLLIPGFAIKSQNINIAGSSVAESVIMWLI